MDDETNTGEGRGRQPTSDHRIVEGGWQKPDAPPKAESRPAGMPQVSAQPPATGGTNSKETADG